ncbi:GNAT family N-acetyltransferase [Aquimarina addita]
MDLQFKIKRFDELEIKELYHMLRLRAEVFIVEQDCVYQDIDNKDQKALHVLGIKNDKIIAYTRLFDAGDYFEKASIGRVVISDKERAYGYGHELLKKSIAAVNEFFNTSDIKISAQCYLKKFYKQHGFKQIGEEYLEDGIPHIAMILMD